MSLTSVSTVEPPVTVALTKPLPNPLYPTTNDFWGKSISTFVNVLQAVPTNQAVEPQKSSIEHIDLIEEPVIEVTTPVQDVPNDERQEVATPQKLETTSLEPDVGETTPDQKAISLSDATSCERLFAGNRSKDS